MGFRTCFAIGLLPFVGSCHRVEVPGERPARVSASDLVAAYQSDPGSAYLAYTDRPVLVRVLAFNAVGSEVHWRPTYPDPLPPPAIVFRFAEAPHLAAPVWIEGTCLGGSPLVVTGCRAAKP